MNNYANAQNLASYGRGNDTQLVHMTPGEVKGLQALALAHGGSLTTNPDTGLTEAGFLEQILPMVAGAGLMMIPGVGPLAAAAMVGGGYGLATGSVEKGLMAGLGAYGGAGLTSSLASLGGEAAAQAGQQAATEGFKTVGQEAVTTGSQEVAKEAAKTAALEGTTLPADYADLYAKTGGAQEFTKEAAQKFLENPNNLDKLTPQTLQNYQSALNAPGTNPQDVINAAGRAQGASGATTAGNVSRGLKEVGTSLSTAGSFAADNVGPLASLALPALAQSNQPKGPAGYQEDEYDRRLKGYKLSPDYKAYEAPRPNPYYRPTYAAEGGVMGSYDDEAGSDTVGMASGGIARYASKGQVNVLQDYLDRQESEESKQRHLSTNPSSYMPDVGIFRDTDVDTAKKDALEATMIRLGKIGKGAGIKPVALPKTSIKGLGDIRGATPEIEEAADGGVMGYNLGGYSDGGRMLKGPGDGMSDSIPASIAGKQPARLADGEFVVPADVVSHLGNGSTDAGAKKLYGMMDKIRHARTGKKKQAPKVNVDKYLPGNKKASGGIAGYASGGAIGYAEGGTANEDVVKRIYQEQLGRAPDKDGLKFWTDALASGQSVANITKGINQSLEGQNFDTQYITSLYRQNLARNPEQEGYQFWLSAAQQAGYTPAEIEAQILASAKAKEQVDRGIVGQKFTDMQLNALESDPFGGRYATESIYDLLPNAVNVSTIGDQKAQFVSPVTQQNAISNLGGGAYTGVDVLNNLQVKAAIDVARANGTLNQTGYDALMADLGAAKTSEQTRAALAKPQGQVVIDALYGQQIGEDVNLAAAQAEGVKRQAVLTKQDPGYYQNNSVLTDAYKKAGETVPFDYNAYKGVDTRVGQTNVVTPQNFQQKQNDLINTLNRSDPYRTSYQPINRGIKNMPDSVQDPYSDAGLQFLYGNMMNQYAPRPADFVNPATFVANRPYTYRPPAQDNLVLNTPVADASKPATPAVVNGGFQAVADAVAASPARAGGLMAINRKKHKRG
jgi:hypothetical protein